MYYFAYGSNLDFAQMTSRCPSAEVVSVAYMSKYRFSFNKRGIGGGHSFANIMYTGKSTDVVYGVLYSVSEFDMRNMDKHEGNGYHYQRRRVTVTFASDQTKMRVYTYIALRQVRVKTFPEIHYYQRVVKGAIEFKLPRNYIAQCIVDLENSVKV